MHCWVSGALFPGCITHVSFNNCFLCGVVVVLCGVLCENCIVDASIKPCACHRHFLCWWWVMVCVISLFFCVLCVHTNMMTVAFVVVVVLVVCSLFRAHGGCLGMLGR